MLIKEAFHQDVEMHSIQSLSSPPVSNVSMRDTPNKSLAGTPENKLLAKRLHQNSCENAKTQSTSHTA